MSLTVSFNPTSISDEEREVLQRLVAGGTQLTRAFEGSAAEFMKVSAAVTEFSKVATPRNHENVQATGAPIAPRDTGSMRDILFPEADSPATGATSPAEAFGLSTPETTPAAAFDAPEINVPPVHPGATPSGVELDSEGLPYDARIHSSSREKIKNGSWKIKRGTGETFIIQVKNELRAALGAPAASPRVNVYPPVETPVVTVPAVEAWPFPTPGVVAPPPPASNAPTTLPEFMKDVGARISSGKLSETDVHAACAKFSVQFHTLAARPDLIPSVWGALNG